MELEGLLIQVETWEQEELDNQTEATATVFEYKIRFSNLEGMILTKLE
jgi:hypothetical protein